MSQISANLSHVHQLLSECAASCGREKSSITLLCVSKTKPVSAVLEAYACGERHFGESYANEAKDKIEEIKAQGYKDIVWHFIGPIQSNKTKIIASCFDIAESVDRIKIATRLNEQRPDNMPPLEVLIQVNISDEEQKSGCSFEEVKPLADFIRTQPKLRLRGFMGIAKETDNIPEIEASFTRLQQLFAEYAAADPDIKVLSLGMTHDMASAIRCGSTEIRIGTAIFGPREYHHHN